MAETRMRTSRAAGRMTLEEWNDLPDEVEGELVAGCLVEEEVPGFAHEVIVVWPAQVLGGWARARGGIAATSGVEFAIDALRGRKPDFTVFLGGRLPPADALVRIPPDIAVEIVSRTARDRRRDRVEKHAEYARCGVRWYSIIDPWPRTLEIFGLRDDGTHAPAFSASGGRHDAIPGCPDLAFDLDDLRAEVDRLS